jgi:hypothetical protein
MSEASAGRQGPDRTACATCYRLTRPVEYIAASRGEQWSNYRSLHDRSTAFRCRPRSRVPARSLAVGRTGVRALYGLARRAARARPAFARTVAPPPGQPHRGGAGPERAPESRPGVGSVLAEEPGDGDGPSRKRPRARANGASARVAEHLPGWLDRELHLLTLRLSADLDTLCWELSDRAVCAAFGTGRAGDDTRRVAHAVRTACTREPDQTVLITPAGLATTLRGPVPGDRHRAAAQRANRPFEVALAADCYLMWRERTDFHPAEIDTWLRRALDSVAAELLDAVVRRCDRIHEALTRAIGELAEPAT